MIGGRTIFILLAAMSSAAIVAPTFSNQTSGVTDEAPAAGKAPQQPLVAIPTVNRPLAELVAQLDAKDPQIRETARETLMLLKKEDLRSLLAAARTLTPLSSSQRWGLREIVIHVFLTDIHKFQGEGSGFIGISRSEDSDTATIAGRTIGYDAFRVLRDGDTIVGLQNNRGPGREEMQPIQSFTELRNWILSTKPGDWIIMRIVRNGQPLEVMIHLTSARLRNANVPAAENPYLDQGVMYWRDTFQPALNAATTAPAQESPARQ